MWQGCSTPYFLQVPSPLQLFASALPADCLLALLQHLLLLLLHVFLKLVLPEARLG
jgi:hypothetical protein